MGPDTTRNLLAAMIGKEIHERAAEVNAAEAQRVRKGTARRKPLISAAEAHARDMNRKTNQKKARKPRKRSRKP